MDKKSVGRDRNHYHEARPSRKEKHGRKRSKNVWIRYVLDIFIRNLLSRLLDVVINNVSWFMSKIYDMISNLLYQFLRVVSLKISEAHAFYRLKSKRRLATILGIRDPKLFKHLDKNLICYRFTIEKAGKTRVLLNPSKPYKKILRKINLLLQNIDFPDYLHSGLKKRNALSNARYHDNKPYVCTMDLKNFFPSTSEVYVYKFFKDKLKMSMDVAKIMTMLVTHEDVEEKKDEKKIRRLPQGFPTSSILSYLVYFDLFNGLNRLTQIKNMKFSVYVDDLTFSSNRKITSSFINKVKSIAFRHQLTIHPEKINQFYNHSHKKITGIILKDNKQLAPNSIHQQINRNYISILDCDFSSFEEFIDFKSKIIKTLGQIGYVRSIEGLHKYQSIQSTLNDFQQGFKENSVKSKYQANNKVEYQWFKKIFN